MYLLIVSACANRVCTLKHRVKQRRHMNMRLLTRFMRVFKVEVQTL
jgi:cell division protein FtsB